MVAFANYVIDFKRERWLNGYGFFSVYTSSSPVILDKYPSLFKQHIFLHDKVLMKV